MKDDRKYTPGREQFECFRNDAIAAHFSMGDLVAIDFSLPGAFLTAANDDEPGDTDHGCD